MSYILNTVYSYNPIIPSPCLWTLLAEAKAIKMSMSKMLGSKSASVSCSTKPSHVEGAFRKLGWHFLGVPITRIMPYWGPFGSLLSLEIP